MSMALEVMKIYLLFYMCHFAMGLTHCYKTGFLHLFGVATIYFAFFVFDNTGMKFICMCGMT